MPLTIVRDLLVSIMKIDREVAAKPDRLKEIVDQARSLNDPCLREWVAEVLESDATADRAICELINRLVGSFVARNGYGEILKGTDEEHNPEDIAYHIMQDRAVRWRGVPARMLRGFRNAIRAEIRFREKHADKPECHARLAAGLVSAEEQA